MPRTFKAVCGITAAQDAEECEMFNVRCGCVPVRASESRELMEN